MRLLEISGRAWANDIKMGISKWSTIYIGLKWLIRE